MSEETGFKAAPDRYMLQGRETIDRMRDEVPDEGFIDFCRMQIMKYTDRGDAEKPGSSEKARWYQAMLDHVRHPIRARDPRWSRDSFTPYGRPEILPMAQVWLRGKSILEPSTFYGYYCKDWRDRPPESDSAGPNGAEVLITPAGCRWELTVSWGVTGHEGQGRQKRSAEWYRVWRVRQGLLSDLCAALRAIKAGTLRHHWHRTDLRRRTLDTRTLPDWAIFPAGVIIHEPGEGPVDPRFSL